MVSVQVPARIGRFGLRKLQGIRSSRDAVFFSLQSDLSLCAKRDARLVMRKEIRRHGRIRVLYTCFLIWDVLQYAVMRTELRP